MSCCECPAALAMNSSRENYARCLLLDTITAKQPADFTGFYQYMCGAVDSGTCSPPRRVLSPLVPPTAGQRCLLPTFRSSLRAESPPMPTLDAFSNSRRTL